MAKHRVVFVSDRGNCGATDFSGYAAETKAREHYKELHSEPLITWAGIYDWDQTTEGWVLDRAWHNPPASTRIDSISEEDED